MANGRMLQRKISSNKQLPKLIAILDERMGAPHGAMASLLYTWSIAHLDSEGRMHGDAHVVKGNVVPRISFITPELIEVYLMALAEVGLVLYYEAKDDRWLAFPGFDRNQPGLRKDRETRTNVPPPDEGKQLLQASKSALLEELIDNANQSGSATRVNGKEEKGKEDINTNTRARDESPAEAPQVPKAFTEQWRKRAMVPFIDSNALIVVWERVTGYAKATGADPDKAAPKLLDAFASINGKWDSAHRWTPSLFVKHFDVIQSVAEARGQRGGAKSGQPPPVDEIKPYDEPEGG